MNTEQEKYFLQVLDYDGTKKGYDVLLTRMVKESVGIPVICSGGAGKKEHFLDAIINGKADAVLAASLFHFKMRLRYLT